MPADAPPDKAANSTRGRAPGEILSRPAPAPNAPSTATSLVGHAIGLRVARRRRKLQDLDWWRRNTARLQHRQLELLLAAGMFCRFGKERHFERILGLADAGDRYEAFADAVPIRDWYAFQGDIAEMREHGRRGVLWPGLVTRFAQTSGTTAGDKFIPVSDEMMRSNYLASLDIFANLINRGSPPSRLMGGKCLFLGGSSDLTSNEHGVATGDLSGLVTPMIRWPLSKIYSPGPDIALMSDWPTKIDAMAKRAIDEDIRFISGMPSWALVLIDRVIELARERGQDAVCARDVWPNLEVFVHGGVNYKPFVQRMSRAFSGDPAVDFPCRQELYPASEGFIAMQDRSGDPGMRLLSDIGTFYEFVPLEHIDDDSPPAYPCWAVEKGQKYVVVMTTNAGLWRYVIGDVVEFDNVPAGPGGSGSGGGGDGPCRLRIVGRHRHFINAFGENLIVEHIEHGVAEASRATGIEPGEFTAAPVYPSDTNRAGLELAIELPAGVSEADATRFGEVFDTAVKAVNVDYTTKRGDSVGMVPPTITRLPMGTFHRWLDARGKLGGQHKCPRCANHREIVDALREAADPGSSPA